jgi:NADH-quinone oxidoreductase subunit M
MQWLHSIASLLPLLAALSPLIGAITVLMMARRSELLRPMALANSIVTVLLIGTALWQFDPHRHDSRGRAAARQMESDVSLHRDASPGIDDRLSVGFDGLAGWPALLVAFSVWSAMCPPGQTDGRSFSIQAFWLFVCESCLIGSFMAGDAIVSLLLLEAALFPICFVMGSYGTEAQRGAATKLWAYQLVGCGLSLLGTTMLAVSRPWMQSDLSVRHHSLSFDATTLGDSLQLLLPRSETAVLVWSHLAPWCVPLILLGMAVRLPLFPFHGWYRSAVLNAPAGVAAVIVVALPTAALNGWLKTGMPVFATHSSPLTLMAGVLAMAGTLHAGIMVQRFRSLKELVATAAAGMFCLSSLNLGMPTRSGVFGAWLTVISQGAAVAAACLAIGDAETTSGERDLKPGEERSFRRPRRAALLAVLLLCWMGVPFLGGLTGSILVLSSSLSWGILAASIAIGATLLTAIAVLRAIVGILAQGGARPKPDVLSPGPIDESDLSWNELMQVVPFLAFLVVVTLAPSLIMRSCEPTLSRLLQQAERTELRESSTGASDASHCAEATASTK